MVLSVFSCQNFKTGKTCPCISQCFRHFDHFTKTRKTLKTRFFTVLGTKESNLKSKVQQSFRFLTVLLKCLKLSLIGPRVWPKCQEITTFMTPRGVTLFEDYCSIRDPSVDHQLHFVSKHPFSAKHLIFSGRLAAKCRNGNSRPFDDGKVSFYPFFHENPCLLKSAEKPRVWPKGRLRINLRKH